MTLFQLTYSLLSLRQRLIRKEMKNNSDNMLVSWILIKMALLLRLISKLALIILTLTPFSKVAAKH
jgi:hypothetical protein